MVLKGVGSMEVFFLWFPWRSALSPWRFSPLISMEVCSFSMEVICVFSMEVIWMVLKGGWLYAIGTFGHWLASRPGMMWLTSALTSSGCAMGFSVPSSWLLRPTLCTEIVFIATFVTFLAPHWAFSRWVRCSTLTAYPTLVTLGSLALTFPVLEGPWSRLWWLLLQLLHWTCVSGSP